MTLEHDPASRQPWPFPGKRDTDGLTPAQRRIMDAVPLKFDLDPLAGALRKAAHPGPVQLLGPEPEACPSLREELQQQCCDWGAYWRAPDAHGVDLTHEQAAELLRRALGVEVEIKRPQR